MIFHSYNDKVGYVPSTYLSPYANSYLQPSVLPGEEKQASPILPTPRRQSLAEGSIKKAKQRDLQPYRRATQKRRQRTIKQQKQTQEVRDGDCFI